MAHLQVVVKFCTAVSVKCGSPIGRSDSRGRLESLVARQALVHAREVDVPGRVHRLGILPPEPVHLLDVVRVRPVREGVVGRRRRGRRERARKWRRPVEEARPVQGLHDTGETSEPVHRWTSLAVVWGTRVVGSNGSTTWRGGKVVTSGVRFWLPGRSVLCADDWLVGRPAFTLFRQLPCAVPCTSKSRPAHSRRAAPPPDGRRAKRPELQYPL